MRSSLSTSSGLYSFPAISPGTYNVSVEAKGFQKQQRSNITIQVQEAARVDFQLRVGDVTQTLEVTGTAELLATDDSTVGQVIENKRNWVCA